MSEVLTQIQSSHNPEANEWILSWLRRLKPGARVLDFASGSGRHALAALQLGFEVNAWDQDDVALQELARRSGGGVRTTVCDLEAEAWPEVPRKYDALVVTNYLFRPRMAFLPSLVCHGGLVLYQTFAQGHELLGRPRRSDFLLRPGELSEWANTCGMHVLAYEDSVLAQADGQPCARIQRLAALNARQSGASLQLLEPWPVKIR